MRFNALILLFQAKVPRMEGLRKEIRLPICVGGGKLRDEPRDILTRDSGVARGENSFHLRVYCFTCACFVKIEEYRRPFNQPSVPVTGNWIEA